MPSPDSSPQVEADDHYRAVHDQLTGLLNREGLSDGLDNLISTRPGQFAILLVDLDDVKKVNDTQGHPVGDELIVRASRIFQETTRQDGEERDNDIVATGREARTGGDEFVLLFPGIDNQEDLQAVQDRLNENLATGGVDASVGGQVHRDSMTATELLTLADASMYKDKERRKIERYSVEQREVIEHIGSVATMHEIDPRDIPAVLSALKNQPE